MAWAWSAPEGVYKDHMLSSKIRMAAIAETQFMPWFEPEEGYGKKKGQSVTITRIFPLPLAGRVSELDRLPTGNVQISTKSLAVSEWGFKLELTEFEQNLTFYDLSNKYQRLLKDQMRLTMDVMAAQALKLTPYKFINLSAGGVFDTDGVPSTQATANLNVDALRRIHDEMRQTLKAPYWGNKGKYIGILSTRAARGLKNDPEYKDWLSPTTSEPFVSGKLKDIEGFELYESNHSDALSNAIGLSGVCGEAVFFGADAGFLAVVEQPELRAGLTTDLGRFRETGWVGTLEAGLTWEIASRARVIHVTSS